MSVFYLNLYQPGGYNAGTCRAADRGGGGQQGKFALGPLCEGGSTTKIGFKHGLRYLVHCAILSISSKIYLYSLYNSKPLPTCVQSRETIASVLLSNLCASCVM